MKKYLILGLSATLALASCKNDKQESPKLKDGKWHAEFNAKDGSIPFSFEVEKGSSDSSAVVTLINGAERVPLEGVTYKGDSIFIPIKAYDTELKGVIKGDSISGIFRRLFSEEDKGLEFKAVYGATPRFVTEGTSADSLDGKWDIQFITDSETKNNVGIFSQKDGILTGSILTNSGDFRYLEGVSDKNGFRLSAFAGLSPYLIQGKFTEKDNFEGEFITARGSQKIKGTRNPNARLADPYGLTQLKKGYNSIDLKLRDLKGNEVSLTDPKFKDKVVIISILGSWCPNCLDEAEFLAPWYKENKDRGVEIVGLAFERKDDPEYIQKVLSNLVKKYDITYDILVGGKISDSEKVLSALDGGLKSYPTTIFIDKKGVVRKIHTGFNGPATGLFYDEFKTDFNKLVNELLAEK
ncbi:TlpA family protein disulfide reductase [Dysgonomonas sp. HDW5B]|uniref:peroxiredoxin family protein n=1 Tax=Dysgonomonas sp. HDW5B TaxID=2714927 RepID=UPI00140B7639|nr:TlpA disulfide reductase family protein [Dysgonomonas sp. HDW5B]QIK53891.1 TlpA family protein disulfide reductase [Dysgonomonas sp. HDW5B]